MGKEHWCPLENTKLAGIEFHREFSYHRNMVSDGRTKRSRKSLAHTLLVLVDQFLRTEKLYPFDRSI